MPDLLSTAAAAEILEVSDETVRRWAAVGIIRHVRLPSGQLRFEAGDVYAIRKPIEPVAEKAS